MQRSSAASDAWPLLGARSPVAGRVVLLSQAANVAEEVRPITARSGWVLSPHGSAVAPT
jgi:hypothetical protein